MTASRSHSTHPRESYGEISCQIQICIETVEINDRISFIPRKQLWNRQQTWLVCTREFVFT